MVGQSKAVEFYQVALDHIARQGHGNANFEVGDEDWISLRSFTRMSQSQSSVSNLII